jgi:hypothetical protein
VEPDPSLCPLPVLRLHRLAEPGRAHVDQLETCRLGTDSRARLRFSLAEVDEWLMSGTTSRE